MAAVVKTQNFEGPFDLLLHLVQQKRLDINEISIAEVTDQYLAEVSRMVILDTETASDFMLVAATLIEIKAKTIVPVKAVDGIDAEVQEMSPLEAREHLIRKLIVYKQFKNAAAKFDEMLEAESKHVARNFGPTDDFKTAEPDFLRGTTVLQMALIAAERLGRKDQYLLAAKHIASKPLNVEVYVETILARLKIDGKTRFSELVADAPRRDIIVVTMLAILELYKRNLVDIEQVNEFGDIDVTSRSEAQVPEVSSKGGLRS